MKNRYALISGAFCVIVSGCYVEATDDGCCDEPEHYGYPPGAACTRDSDCVTNMCRSNICVQRAVDAGIDQFQPDGAIPDGAPADSGVDIDAGAPGDGGAPIDGGGCPYDAGTNDAGTCNLKPKPVGLTCQFNWQCGPGGRCRDGACDRGCSTTADCGTGSVCNGGYCMPSAAPGGQCVWSADCAGGWCINGFCHGKCTADGDCANKHDMCSLGVCQQDTRPTPQCRTNTDCSGDKVCVNGACRAGCYYDSDCCLAGDGYLCRGGYCVSPHEAAPQCQDNTACASAAQCIDAICQ